MPIRNNEDYCTGNDWYLTRAFAHYHVNNGLPSSANDDSCRECLLDLRDPVHSTKMIEARRKWRAEREERRKANR